MKKTEATRMKRRGKKRQTVAARRRFDEKGRAERFREYFERLPLLAYNISLNGMILDCNSLAVETLGYASKGELVGKPLLTTLYAPSSQDKAKRLFLKWKKTGRVRDEELQVITKQGKIIDVLLNVDTIYDEKGRPLHSLSTQLDITERKKADEASRRQTGLLQKTFNAMTDAIFILEAASPPTAPMIVDCNDGASSVFGYEKAEMVGKSTGFLHVSEETLREFQSHLYPAVAEGRLPFHLSEFRMRRKDGSVFPSEHLVTQLLNEKGERTGWISIVRDVTERKRAEQTLRESEEKYRKLFEEAMDGIALADADTGIVVDCNLALAALVGRNRTDLIGQHQTILHPPAGDDSGFSPTFKLHMTTHEGQVLETQVITRTGEIREVEIKANLLYLQGRKTLQGIFRDITERKRMEDEVARRNAIVNAINRVFRGALTCETEEELARTCLVVAEELTGSQGGFIGELNQAGRMDTIAISSLGWDACKMPSSQATRLIRNMELRGIWARVLKDEKSLIVNDPASHPDRVGTPEGHPALTSFIGAPLKQAGRTFGIVGLANKPSGYDPSDMEALETLSVAIVEALMRKRAEEALRRRAEELSTLQATVLDITGRPDLPILLPTIVERAARLLDAPAGGMYLCDPEKQEARCVVSYNTPHDYTGTILKYGEGAAGIVAQTGEPLIIDDYRTWQGRATVFEEERPFKAVLTVPMIWQGRVTGVIHVLDDAPSRRFTPADQGLLTLFANHAAIAVENTRLLEQEKRHAEELTRYSTSLERLVLERTEKLAESERRFRELADLLPQIVFEIDEQGNLLFANRMTFAAIGYTEDDLRIGLNAFHMLAQEDHDRARKRMQRILSGEELRGDEYTVQRKDGSTFPALVNAAPIMRGNKPVGLRGIVIDITEHKRAEEELRSARERLEHVITSNPAVIITGKPRADLSDYNVTYMSDRVVEMLGFEPQQFIGHPEFWDGRVHPDDLSRYPTEVPVLWRKGRCTFEYRFLHKDGTYRWIREEAKVIRDADGNPAEVIGYWTDITEQRQMQEALLKSQRLATIGEVAATVGHDLRNPLAAIAGAAYLLSRQTAETIDNRGREALKIIEKSIEHSDKIINDLLEYSAEIRLQTSTTDPKSITGAVLSLASIPGNVSIVNETQAHPRMVMDADKMQRAFLNIIRNAVEAMPQGGTLTVSSRRTDGMVEFRFEDTGAGMSREILEKLWTPLFTTKARGMGFGLPITRRIVEAHGGTVAANSAPGRGSTFTVKLPIEPQTREVST